MLAEHRYPHVRTGDPLEHAVSVDPEDDWFAVTLA